MKDRMKMQNFGCAVVGFDHRMLWVDDALAEMLGHGGQSLVGRSFEEITHPQDVDLDSHLAEKLFSGKLASYQIEKRFIRKDGSITRLDVHASLVKGPDGNAMYGLAVVAQVDLPGTGQATLSEADRIRRAVLDG